MEYQVFKTLAKQYDIEVTQQQYDDLMVYASLLIDYNKHVNLTTIVELDQIFIKHFLDSLLVSKHINNMSSVADVGTGAGFPGLVLAIFLPECAFTLIEPTQKRVVFLYQVVEKLNLKNVIIIQQRAEDLHSYKEHFDVVLSRAVARLDILLELCIPLIKVKGIFIALKGVHGLDEINISKNALKELKTSIATVEEVALDVNGEQVTRQNIIIFKAARTPNKYPRMYSKIKKQPL
jgi:16S rRNA (guanine527-N7)-methyltransferase